MFEMTGAGKHHGYFVLVSRLQDFLIANGTARGNDGRDSIFRGFVNRVPEGEKRVRSHYRSL